MPGRQLTTAPLTKSTKPPITLLTLDNLDIWKDAEAPVATVTLRRPKQRNAINQPVLRDLEKAFLFLQERFDVRVVIMAGEGKSFSTGADLRAPVEPLSEMSRNPESGAWKQREVRFRLGQGARTINAMRDCDAVTIARVQGHAIGGGFGLMQACDLRVITKDAMLYFPEIDMGNPVPWGLTPMLVRDVGLPVAKELILTGDELDPERALKLGLVNAVVEDEAALDVEVDRLAYTIAAKSPAAVTLSKNQFRSMHHSSPSGDVVDYEPDWLLISKL